MGDPRRAVVGARPTQRRGSVTYFDTAGPHRGLVRRENPRAGRVVLYASWAKRAWKGDGHPTYVCRPPKAAEGGDYHLVFDAGGEYRL